MNYINVKSEIGNLKTIMLHRPGDELLNLTPDLLEELLFDDIPDLEKAKKEHDLFANYLKENGVTVLYLSDLMKETLDVSEEIRNKFIEQFLNEADIEEYNRDILYDYLNQFDNKNLVLKSMAGITIKEISDYNSSYEAKEREFPLAIYPMPNLYFTRDSFSNVGNSISINKMFTTTRIRETIYGEYIFSYHPNYKNTEKVFSRYENFNIEGGDILVISDELLIIGISQRTSFDAIKKLASNIYTSKDNKYKNILAINIPDKRTFMHLDTVFTQVDYNAFVIHPEILKTLKIYDIKNINGEVFEEYLGTDLVSILSKYMNKDIELIYCGGDDMVSSQREQWSDGANTLAIAPKKLVVYKRNRITNEILKSKGYELIELDADNLGVGRGGPRCMSMPFYRE